ncbi:hypothetical protein [Halarchaeum nitratireducens]|uniref:Uncharacterized protein n=1 Tax=Halarchaeum nitratireducens TaxID=489913 RepID=A0A830GAJ9_9EURY|nr:MULTISPECIES: hypothetical protein [Halarchaeum]MBP2250385.1 hypothetical protein [Halarchaeum solikamskense]GGN13148.1 hypothetical protein GCM10009021_11640 [Halarchaeum nitratireducens]
MEPRTALAVGLGAGLGALCLARPDVVRRLSAFGATTPDRTGQYGDDGPASTRATWVVRALGALCLAVAAYVAVA